MENVVIIWSGPAWRTAAIYTGRALLNPLMFEWFMAWGLPAGWQLTTTTDIENFPWFPDWIWGFELVNRMRQQAIKFGARIETKTVDKVDLSSKPFKVFVWDQVIETKSIIVTTWATPKRLGIPGEVRFWKRGISCCAVCDWGLPIFRDKHIVVIWWWNVAMEDALYMTNFASKVTILVRRDVLRCSKVMHERVLQEPKIEIMYNTEAKKVLWEDSMTWLEIINNKTNETSTLECQWLFYAIWHTPNTEFLQWQLELLESGHIKTKPGSTETSVPWVFAAWDVQDPEFRQAITSAWTGAMAWLQAEKYVNWIPSVN